MGNVHATAAAAPAPPPECPMHVANAEKDKAKTAYMTSAAEAKECPVKQGQDPAAATDRYIMENHRVIRITVIMKLLPIVSYYPGSPVLIFLDNSLIFTECILFFYITMHPFDNVKQFEPLNLFETF